MQILRKHKLGRVSSLLNNKNILINKNSQNKKSNWCGIKTEHLEVLGVYFPLAVGKFKSPLSVRGHPLDRAVCEYTLLRPTGVQVLDRLVREYDLFGAVRIVLLDLIANSIYNVFIVTVLNTSGI